MKRKSCLAALLFVIAAALVSCGGNEVTTPSEISSTQAEPEVLTLPSQLECGLTVDSLFQYSGLNPDCNEEEEEDIASLQITNTTGKYVEHAQLHAVLTDGTKLQFVLQDIPADGVVYAFDTANAVCATGQEIAQLDAEIAFGEEASRMEDSVQIRETEMQIELTNISSTDLEGLTVTYHNMLDGIMFGGTAYSQEADIPAGESTILDAWECYMGGVQTVCVSQ